MALEDRVVVVTGGARGIGRVLVEAFASEGSKVVAADRSWEGLDDDAKSLADQGVLTLSCDVTDEASIEAAFDETIAAYGTVDVLVNNAGLRQRDMADRMYTPVLELGVDRWQLMLDVNVLGPLRMTRQFAKPMIEKRSGSIINVGSHTGDMAVPGMQPYAMSKAALKSWTLSLAEELRDVNVAVNVFSPGMSWTTGSADMRAEQERIMGPDRLPPVYKPESCVPLVLLLAQQDARFTGKWIYDVIEWNLLHGHGGHDTWVHVPEAS